MTDTCARIVELRRVMHKQTQRFTRNGLRFPGCCFVRERVVNIVRRRWASFSEWGW